MLKAVLFAAILPICVRAQVDSGNDAPPQPTPAEVAVPAPEAYQPPPPVVEGPPLEVPFQPVPDEATVPAPEAYPPPPPPRVEGPPLEMPFQPTPDLNPRDIGEQKLSIQGASTTLLDVDYVEEPILDVLRAIATAFQLSIQPDEDLGDVKVTLHLENIPVIEGLETLCRSHGLELIADGNVFRIRKTRENTFSLIEVRNGRIHLDVQNQPIQEFLREFVEKTKINIVPAQELRGLVTAHLKDVEPLDGFKAVMAANHYEARLKNGVYLVENGVSGGQNAQASLRSRRRGRFPDQGGGNSEVDVHEGRVNLNLANASLADAIRELAEQAALNYTLMGDISGHVNAQLKGFLVDDALSTLLNGTRYAFIRKEGTLLIGDRNPNTLSGKALSGAELIYLKFIKAESIEKIIPKSIAADNIKVVKEQNALLISGTHDDIALVKSFIGKVDVPTPQVMMEVWVVEYKREKKSDLGIQSGLNANSASGGPEINAYGNMSGVQRRWTNGSWWSFIGFKPPLFEISLKALEAKNKAKILSSPKVMTLNGNKAELKVSRTSYFPVSSTHKDGIQNLDFRPIDDGIVIELTPWVTQHGEVNVTLNPSIKTTGATSFQGAPPPVTNRSISTHVTLRDGQTIALGGLTQSQEDNTRAFVPILGSIPILGYLFSSRTVMTRTTELVIYVTPHILNRETQAVSVKAR